MTTDHDNSWAASSHLPPSISPTTHGEEEEEDARIYRLAAGPRTCDRPPLALLSLNPRPMRSGTRLLGVGVAAAAVVCAWLASCSRAFPFPIPLLEPYTSQKDGERSLLPHSRPPPPSLLLIRPVSALPSIRIFQTLHYQRS